MIEIIKIKVLTVNLNVKSDDYIWAWFLFWFLCGLNKKKLILILCFPESKSDIDL